MTDGQAWRDTNPSLRVGLRISYISFAWTVAAGTGAVTVGVIGNSLVLVAFGLIGCLDAIGSGTVELVVSAGSPGVGKRVGEVRWPPGTHVVAVSEGRELVTPRADLELRVGERVVLLAPMEAHDQGFDSNWAGDTERSVRSR